MSTVPLKQPSIASELANDFPSLQLARTGRMVRVFGRITFVFLVISVMAMFLLPWRQTARGTGTVTALNPQERPQPVKSPAKGVISWVKPGLREGSVVEKGDVVLRLKPFALEGVELLDSAILNAKSKRELGQAAVEMAKISVTIQRQSGDFLLASLVEGLEAARQKWEQAKSERDAMQAELEEKSFSKNVAEDVIAGGLISREELVSKQKAAEAAASKLAKAEAAVKAAERAYQEKIQLNNSKREDIDNKNQSAEMKLNEAETKLRVAEKELIELQTKRNELERLEITAPRSGVIQQWYGVEGSDTVKQGDQMFVIVPETSQLGVEMKVSGNDMPLIKEGDTVRLQFEGWPAVQFVGWPSVAVGTFGGKVNRVFPTDDGKGNFRILVSPQKTKPSDSEWPDDRYLRQGVRANGWVLLKDVPLGYEIWRQLNGFPPTVADEEPDKDKKKGGKVKLPKG